MKISYDAKIKSRPLASFDGKESGELIQDFGEMLKGDEKIVVSIKGEEREGMSRMAVEMTTAFEKYFGCKPDQVVLTKEEMKKWNL